MHAARRSTAELAAFQGGDFDVDILLTVITLKR